MMRTRPQNVGILAIEVYFPCNSVLQSELEVFDKASTGKYTIGLGQDRLGFCTDHEDVISMSLTVVQNLLEKYSIDPTNVGRIEVGSETVIDKSKSIKSCLMLLFQKSGNSDIEGVDSTNACYGGTAALLNAMNWVESSSWDGRYAIVVASDSAVYAEGPARPTGGAGAVAMLIGPDAPIAMNRTCIATYMAHTYDFYKPNLASEYPVVDGKLTQICYLRALDACYNLIGQKYEKQSQQKLSLSDIDFVVCHSPYNKLVQKSFARLLYNDFCNHGASVVDLKPLHAYAGIPVAESYTNRDLEKTLMTISKEEYASKVHPSALIPKQVGNMYCASLYAGLASLLHSQREKLTGKRILMFSYGSGLASSMFFLETRDPSLQSRFNLHHLADSMGLSHLLESRNIITPEEFNKTMELMETRYGGCNFVPSSPLNQIREGVYHLTGVDEKFRRTYERKSHSYIMQEEN
uniref:Hydroxymethylglutaryl-CoA synthase n=1 Tax=Chara vulgaris TaxID=55564 RepID=A4GKI2_CHAVU|nr:cytosolic 3-hydroxy-3-methylglutaryl-CoA synthase [Chara vulgaris]